MFRKIKKYTACRRDLREYNSSSNRKEFVLETSYVMENDASVGFDSHYINHTAWAARILAKTSPAMHIDISSALYFATLISAFFPVEYYEFRPPQLEMDNITFKHGELLQLPFNDNSVTSLSCMHVTEHIGLGRYGDKIDPDGDIKAIRELKRVLAPGGNLLFVVPVGMPKLVFNAHRIYSYESIMEYFSGLHLKQFALITDNGKMVTDSAASQVQSQNYGCGCWWFTK
jgi:SAM-dependent methyltransferase